MKSKKKKYCKPTCYGIECEPLANQYWASGWRNNDGTVVDQGKLPDGTDWDGTTDTDGGNSYWKGGWGNSKSAWVNDPEDDW